MQLRQRKKASDARLGVTREAEIPDKNLEEGKRRHQVVVRLASPFHHIVTSGPVVDAFQTV
jgi:hypothetical protein